MNELAEITRFREQAEKCVSCGLCLYSCPVYAEERDENYVSRGRNMLLTGITDNPDALGVRPRDQFSKCLLCRRCTMVCPQGVRTDLLTVAARAELAKIAGPSIIRKIIYRLMSNRAMLKRVFRTFQKMQWILPVTKGIIEKNRSIFLRDQPLLEADFSYDRKTGLFAEKISPPAIDKRGEVRHIPRFFLGAGRGRHLPPIAGTFLSEEIREVSTPPVNVVKQNKKAAFFTGCAAEFCYPEGGKALIDILTKLGVEVIFPKEQGCCGLPLMADGELKIARDMALHNLRVFSELETDFIVTGCATCSSTLKDGWTNFLARDGEKGIFESFSSRVRDISELIIELSDFKPLRFRSRLSNNVKVTYHDPCHLARYQGITGQPRKILKQVFGENFIEMDNTGCCGLGGSFSLKHYSLSRKIAQRKIDSIARTMADVVVTSCPGCAINLIDNIERNRMPQTVVDIVEAFEPVPSIEDTATLESPKTKTG